nr:MAG TPA: hypothetical protein [Microviridae sp.]
MNQQEALEWAKTQNVVKINAFKENEEDRFTFTIGEYIVSPLVFNTQEEAERYLKDNFKLTNLDLSIIGAMCQRLYDINNQHSKNKEK